MENLKINEEAQSEQTKPVTPEIKSGIRKVIGIGLVALSTVIGHNGYQQFESKKEIEMAGEDIGFDLSEASKNLGIKVSVEIYSPEAKKYVVHIGQTHYRPKIDEVAPEMIKEVISSQKNIESILHLISEKNSGVTNVFCEGVTEDNLKGLANLKRDEDEVMLLANDKDLYKNIYNILLTSGVSNVHADTLRSYIINKKLSSLKNPFNSSEFQEYKQKVMDFLSSSEKKFGKDGIYFYLGAVFKAYYDGDVNILSSEGKTYIIAQEAGIKTHTDIKSMNVREEETLKVITDKKTDQKITPLVFGSAHDFSDNIRDYNSQHPNDTLNLIKIETEQHE